MSKVNHADELQVAIDKAFNEDTQVLVEEMITGREFTIGVFKSKGNITILPITEIKTHKEFFAAFHIADGSQFCEAGTGAKAAITGTFQEDDPGVFVFSGFQYGFS